MAKHEMQDNTAVAYLVLLMTSVKSVRAGLSFHELIETLLMYCKDSKLRHDTAKSFVRKFVGDVYCTLAESIENEYEKCEKEDLGDLLTLVYELQDKKKKKITKKKKAKPGVSAIVNDAEDQLEESGVEPDAPEGAQWDDEDDVPPGEGDGDEKLGDDS